ncbi:MAG: UvrD-helicase domain-containing protein [Prevotella sp.]|nr:UvrD-helicase domain-containing protein [Prevotella sp.]
MKAIEKRKPLVVYKASAGSGKTFRLAVEYIKLLVNNPMAYKNILAVTFTNKATEEMKMRILSQLYGIWKRLPDSKDYMDKVTEELGVTEEYASQRAHVALSNLIHNYNYFRVETIDSFFQSVLRNLARELELTANLHIGLNDQQVEQQAVDELIEGLDHNSKELSWILDFINENIDEDKTWNVIREIKKFGENIFKDIYKSHSKELDGLMEEKDFFTEYTKLLREIRAKAKQKLDEKAKSFFNVLDKNGLTIDDFSYGKGGVCGYFLKLQNGVYDKKELVTSRVENAMNDPMKWLSKANQNPNSQAYCAVQSVLFNLLNDTEAVRIQQAHLYKSADLTLKYMNQLRLLNSISDKVRDLNKSANRFLLSDTQSLLHELIQDSDSPFIFEKIGTQLEHVMIDEFQDTSTVQWENFKVLLKECLSHEGSQDLIVGDVKQSIYRWRSGDWRLLNNIEQEFSSEQMQALPLDINYRSCSNIIKFNNAFFTTASNLEHNGLAADNPDEAPQVKKAYKDVVQKERKGLPDEGLVRIKLISPENYHEEMLKMTKEQISELIDNGIPANKIAILVRSNQTIKDIAEYLMHEMPELKLVSDEAFQLDASLSVNILVEALQMLVHRDNPLIKSNLAKAYQKVILKNKVDDNQLFILNDDVNTLLPRAYVDHMDELLTLPMFDLVERLYSIFGLDNLVDESAYVCAFYDQVSNYLVDNVADIDSFIEAWNDNIHKKTIQSDEIDGIRLITIHKSKGLEFDNVIMPFCDWKLEKSSLIWCHLDDEDGPFNKLPIIPIDFNAKRMSETVYENDYQHEHLQNVVDNLNLLYVGFTRAGNNLFVFGRKGMNGIRSQIIEQCLPEIANSLPNVLFNKTDDKDAPISLEFGDLKTSKSQTNEKETSNVFKQPVNTIHLQIKSFDSPVEFKQSKQSRDFIEGDEEEEKQKSYIRMGNILHNLFSTIRTSKDIPQALGQLEAQGVLYDENVSKDKLMELLKDRLQNERVADWFSDRWTLYNECSILSVNPISNEVVEQRPDRVMIDGNEVVVVDFKFGRPRTEYHTQVRHYMSLLSDMGYQNVKGYLWFVYSNKIEEVK